MKTYVIGAMHGDEVFGLKILGALREINNPNIKTQIGHPEAVAKHRRYLEADLNRSFSTSNNNKESKIARAICSEIDQYEPNYILDIHSSVSPVRKVAIVARLNKTTINLAKATGMDSIVLMPPKIARNSLIGRYPKNAVSLEFGKYQRSDKLALSIAEKINDINHFKSNESKNLPTFKVVGIIPKSHHSLKQITNLRYNSKLNGYPFLAGENTYPTIGGFIAEKIYYP